MSESMDPLHDGEDYKPNGKIKTHKPVVTACGLGSCQPKWMQPCANIKLFTACLALMVAFYGAQMTYVVSVLTTIERAFGFPSSKSGFITSTNDIGFLCTVVPVSYLASKAHKPMVIGVSGLFIGASGVLSAMPYFIWGGGMPEMNEPVPILEVTLNKTIPTSPQMSLLKASLCTISNGSVYTVNTTGETCGKEVSAEMATKSTGAYVVLVVAQVIIGIAASTLWSLGMTFIDDNVKKHVSAIYLGILFSLRTLSPILGFVLGAVFTNKPVDLKPTNLTPQDPQWVGAWWVGFLACGIILFLASIPLLLFPRQLPVPPEDPEKKRMKEEKRKGKKKKKRPFADSPMMMAGGDDKIDLKGFPQALKRLFTNPIYVCIVIGLIFSIFGFIGFFTFLPKYLENQFDLSASQVSMFLALLSALPSAIGTFSSGFLTSKLRLDRYGLAKLNLLLGVLAAVLRAVFIFLGCPSNKIKGLEAYDQYNFTESCNIACGCALNRYNPVCGSNGQSYFTPCHAGCSDFPDENNTFTDCGCISDGMATLGPCVEKCNMLIPFGVLLFLTGIISGLGMMPGIMLNLRSIEQRDKALGMGVLMFMFSIVGIPAPVVFGMIIDGVCMIHSPDCVDQGRCLVYDKSPLRYLMMSVMVGCVVPSLCLGVYMCFYLRNLQKKEKKNKTGIENGHSVETFDITAIPEGETENHL